MQKRFQILAECPFFVIIQLWISIPMVYNIKFKEISIDEANQEIKLWKLSCPLHSPPPGWLGMMQAAVNHGIYMGHSTFTFLPMMICIQLTWPVTSPFQCIFGQPVQLCASPDLQLYPFVEICDNCWQWTIWPLVLYFSSPGRFFIVK